MHDCECTIQLRCSQRVKAIFVIDPFTVFMPDTVILKNEKQLVEHLLRFLNNRKSPLRLCYRASLHSWSAQQFHTQCDDKAGTVVLVKVGNWIFGGYSDQTWQVCQGKNF